MNDPSRKEPCKALLARDLAGTVRILATDSAALAFLVPEVSTDAEDCGLADVKDCPDPGLYVFEGHSQLEFETYESQNRTELVFDGTVRPVRPEEVSGLFAMSPPEEPVPAEDFDVSDLM